MQAFKYIIHRVPLDHLESQASLVSTDSQVTLEKLAKLDQREHKEQMAHVDLTV